MYTPIAFVSVLFLMCQTSDYGTINNTTKCTKYAQSSNVSISFIRQFKDISYTYCNSNNSGKYDNCDIILHKGCEITTNDGEVNISYYTCNSLKGFVVE